MRIDGHDVFDLERFKLEPGSHAWFRDEPRSRKARRRIDGFFIKGPIPWRWISAAARLPGKALHVGIFLWFQHGMKKGGEVKVGMSGFSDMGFVRSTASRALASLENAGLISVRRAPGRKALVKIRDVQAQPRCVGSAEDAN